jgi:hypothetical protein
MLMQNHETLVYQREHNRVLQPAQILCFGENESKRKEFFDTERRLAELGANGVSLTTLVRHFNDQKYSCQMTPISNSNSLNTTITVGNSILAASVLEDFLSKWVKEQVWIFCLQLRGLSPEIFYSPTPEFCDRVQKIIDSGNFTAKTFIVSYPLCQRMFFIAGALQAAGIDVVTDLIAVENDFSLISPEKLQDKATNFDLFDDDFGWGTTTGSDEEE